MTFIRRSVLDKLFQDMISHRDRAVKRSEDASNIVDAYVERFLTGQSRFAHRVDAERSAANDVRWQNAVADNQMYDRFATRDATVLTAVLKMIEMKLLDLVRDSDLGRTDVVEDITTNRRSTTGNRHY